MIWLTTFYKSTSLGSWLYIYIYIYIQSEYINQNMLQRNYGLSIGNYKFQINFIKVHGTRWNELCRVHDNPIRYIIFLTPSALIDGQKAIISDFWPHAGELSRFNARRYVKSMAAEVSPIGEPDFSTKNDLQTLRKRCLIDGCSRWLMRRNCPTYAVVAGLASGGGACPRYAWLLATATVSVVLGLRRWESPTFCRKPPDTHHSGHQNESLGLAIFTG